MGCATIHGEHCQLMPPFLHKHQDFAYAVTAEAMQERGLESSGQMEIILSGDERILVWTDVETAALSRVLKALGRR